MFEDIKVQWRFGLKRLWQNKIKKKFRIFSFGNHLKVCYHRVWQLSISQYPRCRTCCDGSLENLTLRLPQKTPKPVILLTSARYIHHNSTSVLRHFIIINWRLRKKLMTSYTHLPDTDKFYLLTQSSSYKDVMQLANAEKQLCSTSGPKQTL